jgi:hypothetical protein
MSKYEVHKARMGRKLRGKPGDLVQLQLILWYSLKRAQGILDVATDDETTLKAVHCISQVAGQYAKLLEIGELEARIAAMEAATQKGIA